MYDVIALAKYIINKCTQDNWPISNLQLQKILYYVQINFYRIKTELAFENDFQAWKHGPVVPEVYDEFSMYGGTKIARYYEEYGNLLTDEADREIIDLVTNTCKVLNPWDLVGRSHKEGGPWDIIYNGVGPYATIPIQLIQNYSKQ